MTMADSDVALVERAKEGDRASFEELVRRTSGLVYARLYLETGDAHRAEDLVQETYLIAFRSLGGLEAAAGFRSWLLTIAQNAAIDAARYDSRKKRQGTMVNAELRLLPGPSPRPDELAERSEAREQVLSILRSLPEEYRLPLTLRYITGADYDSIQMQLGLSNGSLRGLLHRGLKLLRDRLERTSLVHA